MMMITNSIMQCTYQVIAYLNAHVDSGRTSFDLPLEDSLEVFQDGIAPNDKLISIESIKREVLKLSKIFLSKYLI